MNYRIVEEASEAVMCFTSDLKEAIEEAKSKVGKYLVLDENDSILFDSQPGISYKI
jgi:hypothetical protein